MEMQTQTWTIGEFRFTVDTNGPVSGPPVLLLHGFPQTRHMWRHQLRALAAAGFRGVAPDQRGYSAGARPAAIASYASELLTADALALMDFCEARRFHLVGHDWGGQLAWLIGAGHPDRVATLTTLSRPHPGAFARAMAEDPGQAKRSQHHSAFCQPDAISRLRQDNFKTLRAALERDGVENGNLDAHFETLSEPGALEAAISWYRANNIASTEIPAVSVPTLYIWGTADSSVGRRAAELTEQFVSGPYRFVEVEGGGHFIVDQFPDRIADLMIEHLHSTSL
jgi:pimeloyl-ACP methyl ester carboxylesterase